MRPKGREKKKVWGRVRRALREADADWVMVVLLDAFSIMALSKYRQYSSVGSEPRVSYLSIMVMTGATRMPAVPAARASHATRLPRFLVYQDSFFMLGSAGALAFSWAQSRIFAMGSDTPGSCRSGIEGDVEPKCGRSSGDCGAMPVLYGVGDGEESEMRFTGVLKVEGHIRNLYESTISWC